jgi:tRNA (cmo5U34)-methyltransferase
MTKETQVKQSYDDQSGGYDSFIRHLVPDYDIFNNLTAELLSFNNDDSRVLDIGCGTGETMLSIKNVFPNVQGMCIDISEAMVDAAREKLKKHYGIEFVCSDIADLACKEKFDAVVSVLVLHNIQTTDERVSVYRKIFDLLAKGGIYISVDVIKSDTPDVQAHYIRKWRQFMLTHISEEEVDGKWLSLHASKDKPVTPHAMEEMLHQVGFEGFEIIHKNMNFMLTVCYKPYVTRGRAKLSN